MSLEPYPEYKESGQQWLGRVPSHWEVRPSKSVFGLRNEPERIGDVHLTPSQSLGVLPQTEYMKITENKVVLALAGTTMKHVEVNDFVIHLRSFQGGIEWSGFQGKVSPAYTVLRPGTNVVPAFFRHCLKSRGYIETIASLTDQLRDGQSMRYYDFGKTPLPLPAMVEQQIIADFIDRETSEIDAFIADQKQLIALLTERRTATIIHAVTRGLNADAPAKSSGVDWLNGTSVPSQWGIWKLGRLVRLQSGESITAESIEKAGTYPVYGGGGLRGYTESYTNNGEHALIGRQGALCGNIKRATGYFFATEHAIVVYPMQKISTSWLAAILQVMDLGQYSQSAAQPGISVDIISQKRLPVPPLHEQKEIAEYLDREAAEIDAAIADAHEAITLSKERRTALISAAVTGKIDVRGLGASANTGEAISVGVA